MDQVDDIKIACTQTFYLSIVYAILEELAQTSSLTSSEAVNHDNRLCVIQAWCQDWITYIRATEIVFGHSVGLNISGS